MQIQTQFPRDIVMCVFLRMGAENFYDKGSVWSIRFWILKKNEVECEVEFLETHVPKNNFNCQITSIIKNKKTLRGLFFVAVGTLQKYYLFITVLNQKKKQKNFTGISFGAVGTLQKHYLLVYHCPCVGSIYNINLLR